MEDGKERLKMAGIGLGIAAAGLAINEAGQLLDAQMEKLTPPAQEQVAKTQSAVDELFTEKLLPGVAQEKLAEWAAMVKEKVAQALGEYTSQPEQKS